MLTREPSFSRASTIGLNFVDAPADRATAMRWQTWATCPASRKRTPESSSLPWRSTKTRSGPFTMMSVIAVVLEQRLERAKPEHVVDEFMGERALLAPIELNAPLRRDFGERALNFLGQLLGGQF